ncbi:hypothetical protein [Paenibacillus sp. NPDC058071]|uniref:hypothetical protein n=1 Tax=Paenibacillus sp. NPDC058071 TaxID=3346326 RepID=UPI0036DC5686
MEYFKPYEEDVRTVFEEVRAKIGRFPEPFSTLGQQQLEHYDPFKADSAKNYICYLLPYWMTDAVPLSRKQAGQLTTAGLFYMLYYFIVDDAMDADREHTGDLLALGHLFHIESQLLFQELFPGDSPFWSYMRKYVQEWAVAVVSEKKDDYFQIDPLLLARKAAPVKLYSTGAMLLTGQPAFIDIAEQWVDRALTVLQMADDWQDWREDLENGSYNSLLSMLGHYEHAQDSDAIMKEIHLHMALDRFLERLALWPPLPSSALKLPYLSTFSETIVNQLVNTAARIRERKADLLAGGLHHYLKHN